MPRTLVSNVYVSGGHGWFGPDYPDNEVTPEIEARITNPKAWDGEAPTVEPTPEAGGPDQDEPPKAVKKAASKKHD